MILVYHKIDMISHSEWWVTPRNFHRQMLELREFDVVPLDDYDPGNSKQAVITFDGVYENVHTLALPILRKFGYPFEMFVIGDHVGGDNAFDTTEPGARFATRGQLTEMVEAGGRLQWHTNTHADMTTLAQVDAELEVPAGLRELDPGGFKWFAYPHDRQAATEAVQEKFNICPERKIALDDTRLSKSTVSLIIPNYNYGQFIEEAIDSALRQTLPVAETLVIDDCSTDASMDRIARYGQTLRAVRNESNLGIIKNFNKAVSLTSGDYICFLGADNRFRSDYIEKCKAVLDAEPQIDIVYTNAVLFGPRAEAEAIRLGVPEKNGLYVWEFPEFDPAILEKANFIHGSSMYRRSAYERVGGYKEVGGPEDYGLFLRMVKSGSRAKLIAEPLLEYRQHSGEQANIVRSYSMEIARLKKDLGMKAARIANLERQLAAKPGLTLHSF